MNYNIATITSRLKRLEDYFQDPKLRSVISGGASELKPEEISRKQVHRCLEENTWCENLVKWVRDATNTDPNKERMIGAFIIAFCALEGRQQWGEWGVDSGNNDWSAIWIRLTDKSRETFKKREFTLSPQDAALLQAVYLRYKDGKHGVDDRRVKHEVIEKEFTQLFGAPEFSKVDKTCRQDVAEGVTPKHCGLQLLEVEDQKERSQLIEQYYNRLTVCAKEVPLAIKLADHFVKHVGTQYAENYNREIPEADKAQVLRLDAVFRKALV